MRKSQKRFIMDIDRIQSDEYASICRIAQNDFIRNRKMPLQDLLLSMINRKGLTLTLELRNFMKTVHPGTEISKPGYLKQRIKLNPDAFVDLYHYHNKNFYSESGYATYNGYLILAADGSNLNIPTTKETLETFGTSCRKNTKPQASIGLGCLYDVMNRMIIESDCNRCKFDEMAVAESQIDRVYNTIGKEQPFLVVMDRGYPSTPAFIRMMDKNIYFIVRLKNSDYKKEQASLECNDKWIDIELDKTRIRHYEGTAMATRMRELGNIRLRMVKIYLDDGNYEILLTNLKTEQFSTEQLADLYHMRWSIETAYETLKSRLQIENFTGTKPQLLLQDIYSTIYVSNLAEDIILETQQELDEKDKNYKYKMAINQTVSIGILKNDLIYIMLEKDKDKQEALFNNLYDDISKNLVPVRPNRHYKRTKGQLAGKYSNTHKRAF